MILLTTLVFLMAISWLGVHCSKPRVTAHDLRRADHAESLPADDRMAEGPERAFEASTWAHG